MAFDPSKYNKTKTKSGAKASFQYTAVPTLNVNTLDGIAEYARSLGIENELVDTLKPKESLFSKTVDFISRPLYASAGFAKALVKNKQAGQTVENPLIEAWKGLTEQEKETYSDVLAETGVHNKWIKGGVGFALDVALDPLTYFGGFVVKGAAKTLGAGGKVAMKGVTKFDPVVAQNLTATGNSIRDALGRAFVKGYGGSKVEVTLDSGKKIMRYFTDDVGRALNKLGMAKEDFIKKYAKLNRFDEKTLSKATDLMIENRQIELAARQAMEEVGSASIKVSDNVMSASTKATPDAVGAIEKYVFYNKKTGLTDDVVRQIDELNIKPKKEVKLYRDGAVNDSTIQSWSRNANIGKTVVEKTFRPDQILVDLTDPRAQNLFSDIGKESLEKYRTLESEVIVKPKSMWGETVSEAKEASSAVPSTTYKTASDPKTAEALQELKKMGQELGELTKTPDMPKYEWYYPMIDKTKLGSFGETGGSVLEQTKQGYLKKWENKIPDANILRKAPEALARREAEIVRNAIADEVSQHAVTTYGATLKDFKTLADDAFFTKYGAKKSEYQILKTNRYGKEIGALKKRDIEILNETFFPEMKTIDMLAKASGFDKFTSIFKSAVTAFFPAFHVRNFISGIIQNYQVIGRQAFNPKNLGEGLAMIKGKPTTVFNYKNFRGTAAEANKAFRETFETSSRYISDLGKEIDILSDLSFNMAKIGKLDPRRLGNFIETWQKTMAMSASMRKGATLEEALQIARKSGFDYTRVTAFEAKIMRRAIPFYSFMRFNAELQMRTLAKNPERILNQIKFTKGLSEIFGGGKPTEEDLAGLPDWALAGLGFKVAGNRYLTKFGLPLEEFVGRVNDPVGSTLTSMNPLIKYPLEAKMGYDFFREQKITDINQIAPATGELLMSDKAPKWLKEFMNVKKSEYLGKVRYTASPKALHVLRNLPTSRVQNTIENLFKDDQESIDKWLAFFSGARVYDIDTELQKYFREKDLLNDIGELLMQRGDIKEFNRYFVPKNEASE